MYQVPTQDIFLLTVEFAYTNDLPVAGHCVESVQIRSYFWSVFSCIRNTGKYGPEKTPYLDAFHAVGYLAVATILKILLVIAKQSSKTED